MKKVLFSLLPLFFFFSQTNAQVDSIKQYPLRDYIAPDIKYQSLDFYTGLNFMGNAQQNNNTENAFRTNLNLNYSEYINLSNFQGISDAYFNTSFQSNWGKNDTLKDSQSNFNVQLHYIGQNRIYNSSGTFWGLHGRFMYNYSNSNTKSYNRSYNYNSQSIGFLPYISFGKGRIQPIESARQAQDILIALQQNSRLSQEVDKQIVDSLAREGNRIRYKRFYDQRYKRIYQLEELDKAIRDMDLVDSLDIVYFANLSDIWDFADSYKRGSGLRIEGGLVPDLLFWFLKYNPSDNDDGETKHSDLGIYGFVSLNRMRPISYAWQSDLMIDLTFGYGYSKYQANQENSSSNRESDYLKSMLNASWQFGFYPNTRTYLSLTPFSAATYQPWNDVKDERFGWASGLKFSSYYYVSPRFRLSLGASLSYAENLDRTVPSPFWNTVSYYSQYYLNTNTNDITSFPIDASYSILNKLEYYFHFSLRYAIF